MNGKILVVALVMIAVSAVAVAGYNAYLSEATCGQNVTMASYSFDSDTSLSPNLCKVGSTETVVSYQVTETNGASFRLKEDQIQPITITSKPASIHVDLTTATRFRAEIPIFSG